MLHRSPQLRNFAALIVVALLLIGLGLPAIQAAREAARQSTCSNNLKHIGIGLQNYCDTYNCFPYGTWQTKRLEPAQRLSWLIGTKGFILDGQVDFLFDTEAAWNSKHNLSVQMKHLGRVDGEDQWVVSPVRDQRQLRCPDYSFETSAPVSPLTYPGVAGIGVDGAEVPVSSERAGFWAYDRFVRPDNVTDGLAYTLTNLETTKKVGPWSAGGPTSLRSLIPSKAPPLGEAGQFGGLHPDLCLTLQGDAAVRRMNEAIDPAVLAAWFTIHDGHDSE